MVIRNGIRGYVLILLLTATLGTAALVVFASNSNWSGSTQLHTDMEITATILALVVGVSLLTRFAIVGGPKFMLLGLGFTGAAILDGYHGVVISSDFHVTITSVQDSLSPWSWMPSRVLLGFMFLLVGTNLWASWLGADKVRGTVVSATIVGTLGLITLLVTSLVPLPRAYYTEMFFGRPQEFLPAILFLIALLGFLRHSSWRSGTFEAWVTISIMINLVAQVAFMSVSERLYDAEFDIAHLLKIASYAAVFIGVMIDFKRTIQSEQEATAQLQVLARLQTLTMQETAPAKMFPVIAEQIKLLVGYDRLTIATVFPSEDDCKLLLAYETGVTIPGRGEGTIISSEGTNVGYAPFEEPFVVDDVMLHGDPHSVGRDTGLRAWAEVPLVAGGGIVGVLGVRSKTAEAYSPKELSLLKSAAGHVAPSIRNAFLFDQMLKSEQQVREQAEKLSRSNDDLEQFAYIASHDLQEPLRKVSAFGDRLRSALGDEIPPKAADYLARMTSSAKRMQSLVQGLLEFSRIGTESINHATVDLDEALEEVLEELQLAIQECSAQVTVKELASVHGNGAQLRQVFSNLVINAIKYSRPEVAPEITISATESGGWVEVTVADNGQGFEERHCEQIFNIFKRLHSRSEVEGMGLGLALCRRIIERHGGTISATSKPGEGSEFVVRLISSDAAEIAA